MDEPRITPDASSTFKEEVEDDSSYNPAKRGGKSHIKVARKYKSYYLLESVIKDFGYDDSHPLHTADFENYIPNYQPSDDPYEHDYDYSGGGGEDDDDDYDDDDDDDEDDVNVNGDLYYGEDDVPHTNNEGIRRHNPDSTQQHINTTDEINCKARALFNFDPENDNEIKLIEGQIIWISYRHGHGWLVAEDPVSGENGLVPEEYVELWYEEEDEPKRFLPDILNNLQEEDVGEEEEWIDTEDEDDEEDVDEEVSRTIGNVSIS